MATTSFDPAGRLHLTFRRERDGSKVFVFKDADDADYDITALDFELRIKKKSTSTANVLLLTVGDGLAISGNELTVTVTDEDTNLPADFYWWELYNVTTDETWIYGNVYVVTDGDDTVQTLEVTLNLESETVNLTIQNSVSGGGSQSRGSFNASVTDSYPTNGSGVGGQVMQGDYWYVSVSGLNTDFGGALPLRAFMEALVDSPGQTASNWRIT